MSRSFAKDRTLNTGAGRGLFEGFGPKDGLGLAVRNGNKVFVPNGWWVTEKLV